MMSSTCRMVSANAIDIFITEEGRGPLVILCHGWPELSYSWRHQMPVLAAAGFRVVSPDMRGFGRSSVPADTDAYSIFDLVGDMVGLTQALGEEHAVIVGHDWGAQVAWHCALFLHGGSGLECALRPAGVRAAARQLEEARD
jgi:pimeloyl-ACP methyl ester carboxylesterase